MILIGLALAIIASFGLAKILADWDLEGIGIACVIFSSVALVIALIAVPILACLTLQITRRFKIHSGE